MFCWNSLFDVLWANTSLAVCSHFELRSLISMIQQVLVIGISFLFPQTMKTHRTNRSLERFVATLMTIQGFLQARLHRNKRRAKQVAHLAVSTSREALIEFFLVASQSINAYVFHGKQWKVMVLTMRLRCTVCLALPSPILGKPCFKEPKVSLASLAGSLST
jgi:hypothetical protein